MIDQQFLETCGMGDYLESVASELEAGRISAANLLTFFELTNRRITTLGEQVEELTGMLKELTRSFDSHEMYHD
jgi:hypothetical protein